MGSVINDEGSKHEILSRIAQTTAALIRLKPVWIDKSISRSSKIRLMHCTALSHPSSCMLVNHGPSQQSSKEEYKSWKWGAAARYYASRTKTMFIIIIINLLTARVARAPQMISQPVSSIFLCSPLSSGNWRTPGLSIPWCCLPTSSFVFFPLSLCLARWFWPDPMNGKHDPTTANCSAYHHTTAVCS